MRIALVLALVAACSSTSQPAKPDRPLPRVPQWVLPVKSASSGDYLKLVLNGVGSHDNGAEPAGDVACMPWKEWLPIREYLVVSGARND